MGVLFTHHYYLYTDDDGNNYCIGFAKHLADVGGHKRLSMEQVTQMKLVPPWRGLNHRHVRVHSLVAISGERRAYRSVPAQQSSPLWQSPIRQIVTIMGDQYEVIKGFQRSYTGARKQQLQNIEEIACLIKLSYTENRNGLEYCCYAT